MKSIRLKTAFLGLFFIAVWVSTTAQTTENYIATIEHYSLAEGLSSREVSNIYEDSQGFIWIPTQYGLNRLIPKYQGVFQWFTKETHGLPSNPIWGVKEDKAGWLWIFHYRNPHIPSHYSGWDTVSLMNTRTGEFITPTERFGQSLPFELTDDFIIHFLDNGNIYFLARKESLITWFYSPHNGFKKIDTKLHAEDNITPLKSSILLVNRIEENKRYSIIKFDNYGKTLKSVAIEGIVPIVYYVDDNQNIIYRQSNELFQISSNGKRQLITKTLPMTSLTKIQYDAKQDCFWYLSDHELFIFSLRDSVIYDFKKTYPVLVNTTKRELYFDKNGLAWLATDNGCFKINLRSNPFQSYLNLDISEYPVAKLNTCRGIIEIDHTLFVNNPLQGTYKIDLKNNTTNFLSFSEYGKLTHPYGIYKDKVGDLWIGHTPIIHKPIKTGQIQELHPIQHSEAPFLIHWSFYEVPNQANTLWFGTDKGLYYLDKLTKKIQPYQQLNGFESINKHIIYQFFPYADNITWLITSGGIFEWHHQKGITNHYWTGGKGNYHFPFDNLYHLHKDKNGVFWVATAHNGLIKWSIDKQSNNTFHQYTKVDGLSSNTIYAVYEAVDYLWLPSNYGIMQFDKQTGQCKAYLPKDGTTHFEFNRGSHHQATDGRLYFGSINGVTAFYPKEVVSSQKSQDIQLELLDFQQFSDKTNQLENKLKSLITTKKIVLQPGDKFFDLEFALLNYNNFDNIQYAYIIEGFYGDWQYTNENSIRVSSLPYGNFDLKIKGQNPNGQFSNQELHFQLIVIRPIYKQWWFMFLMIIGSLGLLYFGYKTRTRQLKNRQIELEEQVAERTAQLAKQADELRSLDKVKSTFFANVSHELRTPLTLMLAPINSVLKSERLNNRNFTFLTMAQQNGKKLLKLINEILDLNKLTANKLQLNQQPTVLYLLTRRIIAAFESYAEYQKIQFQFEYKAEQNLQIQLDANKYEIILNNLLSNAFKFTPENGKVTIVVEDNANAIGIFVIDTGRGIYPEDLPHIFDRFYQTKRPDTAAEGGTGIGLALCREFAQLFGGKITVKSDPNNYQEGKGSTFYFEFPKQEVLGSISDEVALEIGADNFIMEADKLLTTLPIETSSNLKKETHILIVEDNPTLRQYLATILSDYQVTIAANGKEALEKLAVNSQPLTVGANKTEKLPTVNYQLIISDVMMPIMDGFQLLNTLKSLEKYRHIPVIMLTARAAVKDKLHALRIGVDDYILKPFLEEELLIRITNLLANAKYRMATLQTATHEAEPELEKQNTINAADSKWLQQLETYILETIGKHALTSDTIAQELYISRSQLFAKVKRLTGLTLQQYIKEIRLEKARTYLLNQQFQTVKEVVHAVGLKDHKTFTKNFKKRFGKLPSDYF